MLEVYYIIQELYCIVVLLYKRLLHYPCGIVNTEASGESSKAEYTREMCIQPVSPVIVPKLYSCLAGY